MLLKVFALFIFLTSSTAYSDNCSDWFKDSKIKTDKGCLLKCTTLMVDMDTFRCHDECAHFCKEEIVSSTIFTVADLYPGLTDAERALAAREPIKTLEAYQLTWKSEELCLRIFRYSGLDDESDACRHFIWSALLNNSFGEKFSTDVLTAHEATNNESKISKEMDLANNKLGQSSYETLKKNGKFSEDNLLDAFRDKMKNDKLKVIKKNISNRKVK